MSVDVEIKGCKHCNGRSIHFSYENKWYCPVGIIPEFAALQKDVILRDACIDSVCELLKLKANASRDEIDEAIDALQKQIKEQQYQMDILIKKEAGIIEQRDRHWESSQQLQRRVEELEQCYHHKDVCSSHFHELRCERDASQQEVDKLETYLPELSQESFGRGLEAGENTVRINEVEPLQTRVAELEAEIEGLKRIQREKYQSN